MNEDTRSSKNHSTDHSSNDHSSNDDHSTDDHSTINNNGESIKGDELNDKDRNLVLLLSSNELNESEKSRAELLIQSNFLAQKYYDELAELESALAGIDPENETEFSFVTNALQTHSVSDVRPFESAEPKRSGYPAYYQFMMYAAALLAVFLASVSIFKIMESNRGPKHSASADPGRSDSMDSNSSKDPTNSKKKWAGNQPVKKILRIFHYKSDLRVKIQYTRSKIKSFKKRLEKRS